MEAVAEIPLEATIYNLLIQQPDWARYLDRMLKWEMQHPSQYEGDGWLWQQVQTPTTIISPLVVEGAVKMTYKSANSTCYRLTDLEATRNVLDMIKREPTLPGPAPDIDTMFAIVVGHTTAKTLLTYTLKADSAVHVLLVGPVGTAKTLMLSEIGRLPGAEFYVGSTTTKAGLVGLLLTSRPKYLVLDEIDKMNSEDQTPLLNLMETGVVTRLQHGVKERITLDTRVFAGANEIDRIQTPILSRFAKVEIPAYSPQEFVNVAQAVLVQREGLGPEMARHVATEVVKYSTDIRDAVRVARLARRDPMRVFEVIRCMWPHGAGPAQVTPIRR